MNIVYGGSFNPPTKAHKEIINLLFERFKPNNIIILPVSTKYAKSGLIDDIHRFEMIKLLDKRIIASDLEINKEFSGTYVSLKKLSEEYDDIHYVIGADNLGNLNKWINFEKLIQEFKFVVIKRNNIDIEEIINEKYLKYKDQFILVESDLKESSSKYRLTKDKNLLTNEINDYIENNQLYKE